MKEKMIQNHFTVETILRDYPTTRASDQELILRVWESQGLDLTDEQKDFIIGVCVPAETIRRTRQKFQEAGSFRATKEIQQEADLERDKKRNRFSKQKTLFL